MHYSGKFNEQALKADPVYENHSQGYTQARLVNHESGSVHTGLTMNQLAAGGTISAHVHAYEKGFYVLSGQVLLGINDQAHILRSGDYGVVKVGTTNCWRNMGSTPARWLQIAAPQPKPAGSERDTFFLKNAEIPTDGVPFSPAAAPNSFLGHFDVSQIPPMDKRPPAAAPGLEGVSLNWLIDEKLGARHHRMALIEYQPGVGIGLHDHTFEESYFILSGEVEGVLDGKQYVAKPGDVVWTAVGCVHSFVNKSKEPVRWLETFAPQPPAENAFRFMTEWQKRAQELEA